MVRRPETPADVTNAANPPIHGLAFQHQVGRAYSSATKTNRSISSSRPTFGQVIQALGEQMHWRPGELAELADLLSIDLVDVLDHGRLPVARHRDPYRLGAAASHMAMLIPISLKTSKFRARSTISWRMHRGRVN